MALALLDRCVLHIGPPKTGTTAIQQSLHRAREALLAAGFVYPGIEANHQFLVSAAMSEPERFDYNRRAGRGADVLGERHERLLAHLRGQVAKGREAGAHTLIVSSEHTTLLKGEEVERLRQILSRCAERVEVFAYARNPVHHVSSLVQQRARDGVMRLDAAVTRPPVFPYRDTIEAWTGAVGRERVHVRPFPGDPPDAADVVPDFLAWIGAPAGLTVETVRANEALSAAATRIADYTIPHAGKDTPERRRILPYITRIRGRKFLVDRAVAERALALSARHLDYLRREWGIDFSDLSLTGFEAAHDGLDEEALASIAALIVELAAGPEAGQG